MHRKSYVLRVWNGVRVDSNNETLVKLQILIFFEKKEHLYLSLNLPLATVENGLRSCTFPTSILAVPSLTSSDLFVAEWWIYLLYSRCIRYTTRFVRVRLELNSSMAATSHVSFCFFLLWSCGELSCGCLRSKLVL
jgi:hypothetical protein